MIIKYGCFFKVGDQQNHRFQYESGLILDDLDDLEVPQF